MIPQEVIEELKYRSPIEEVISSYVTLKRAGANYNGLCPFHSEKTPSFTVFPKTSSFYCFGCGAGGDVVSFIMRAENLEYRQALDFLAKRAGISLPEDGRDRERTISRNRLYEMNVCAAKFFRDTLYDEVRGAEARKYLVGRGLSQAIIRRFGLGFADGSFDSLRNHLRKAGYKDEEIVTGFLCARSQKNDSIYDIFRNRVMFPIIDTAGNIVAFGGRVLDHSEPKYLNSSDTPAFNKRRNLFALNFAKAHAADYLILCEGYMDVIALHEAGFECAVATLGTAITPDQARILAKYTKRVIISYDSDEAGQRAADKAFRLLDEVGLDARLLKVENAKDPDEYVRKFGAEKFRQMIEGSRTRFDFVVSRTLAEHDIESEAERVKAARALCAYIATVPSSVERDIYISKLAQILSVTPDSVRRDVEISIRRRSAETKKKNHETLIRETAGLSDRVNPDFAKRPLTARLEEAVLGMLMLHPEYAGVAVDGQKPGEGDFFTDYGRRLFSVICEAESDGGFNLGQLPERFTEDEVSRAVKLMLSREKLDDNGETVFCDSVRRLRDSLGTGSDISDIEELLVRRREKKT